MVKFWIDRKGTPQCDRIRESDEERRLSSVTTMARANLVSIIPQREPLNNSNVGKDIVLFGVGGRFYGKED